MLTFSDSLFRLDTAHTTYLLCVTPHGHPEHLYYGRKLPPSQSADAVRRKNISMAGSTVLYDESDPTYCLDMLNLEWSGIGRGDFRYSPCEILMPDGSFACDFQMENHEIISGCVPMNSLPSAYSDKDEGRADTLRLDLRDKSNNVSLSLYYTVFEDADVITRRAVLKNHNAKSLVIRRLLSMMVDMPLEGYRLVTFDGGWIKEAQRHERPLAPGLYITSSTTGASSNRHNPGFLLASPETGETSGEVYGFNLIYSGNHISAVELDSFGSVRVATGINPHAFQWTLGQGESFETPEAVMTHSDGGFNGLSQRFHGFVKRHIVRGEWKDKERPVLLNTWEGHSFHFSERTLLRSARQAKKLGVELFVLDDGWFGKRDDDTSGLGDYTVNRKKLRHGLQGLSKQLRRMGLDFGLWVEPEMVNEDSDLYRTHPDWAVRLPGKAPTRGRHQLVLDLCNPEVRDYIVTQVGTTLDEAGVTYVKWDMNRHISEMYSPCLPEQGRFFHAYILGLYEVMGRIFMPRPHILFESCSSGGNRFDLGMLCYSPQIWASDNTDPIARLDIQGGLSYLYPQSTIGAHVSQAPHAQTLRNTPLSTRFHASCFGLLGYELDVKDLSRAERREIAAQIAFYKEHRKTLQYGIFSRIPQVKANKIQWQCVSQDGKTALTALFQTIAQPSESDDRLCVTGLPEGSSYTVRTRPQTLFLSRFGHLLKHVLPVTLRPHSMILHIANQFYALPDGTECYTACSEALASGIGLNQQFIGSYYNPKLRLLGDFGSQMYVAEQNP